MSWRLNILEMNFKISLIVFLGLLFFSCSTPKTSFKFGVVADCQYCAKPTAMGRFYQDSTDRLKEYVLIANQEDLLFTVHLGDFIDEDEKSFKPVLEIFSQAKAPIRHVLGNHDFSVSEHLKNDVPKILQMPAKYYSFTEQNWRFLVLDGNDISFHAYPKDSQEYKDSVSYYNEKKITKPKYNGAMGAKQLAWVEEELKIAAKENQNVILFSHFPVYPENGHNLWNDLELMALLEKYPCVKSYINGHNHKGNYGFKNGIHYFTQKGMVENKVSTFTFVEVKDDQLLLKGFGNEKDRVMNFSKSLQDK